MRVHRILTLWLLLCIISPKTQAQQDIDALLDSLDVMEMRSEEQALVGAEALELIGKDTLDNPEKVFLLVRLYTSLGDWESVERHSLRYLQITKETPSFDRYQAEYNLGLIYQLDADWEQALTYFIASAKTAEALEDDLSFCRARTMMGHVSYQLHPGQPEVATGYLHESIAKLKSLNDSTELPWAYNNLANLLAQIDPDSSRYYYEQAMHIFRTQEVDYGLPDVYYNLGLVWLDMEELDSALKYIGSALTQWQELEDTGGFLMPGSMMAYVYMKKGELDKTHEFLELANLGLAYSERATDYYEHFLIRSKVDSALGNYLEAYVSLSRAYVTLDSFSSALLSAELSEMQVKYETERKDKELAETRAENNARKVSELNAIAEQKEEEQEKWIVIRVAILLVVIIVFIILWFRQKRRAEAANKRLLVERLEHEEAEAGKLREELAFRAQSLTSYSVLVAQKNEIIQGLEELIKSNRAEIPVAKEMTSLIRSGKSFEDEWEQFRVMFDEVHPGFSDRLLESFPELTANEVRLCALLRMNLSSKQIASILNIAPRSVDVGRSRMRKKMKLDSSSNLSDFIMNF